MWGGHRTIEESRGMNAKILQKSVSNNPKLYYVHKLTMRVLIPVILFFSTVCPSIVQPGTREEDDEIESDVYEDPAVLYEGVVENPDPIDLENYLVYSFFSHHILCDISAIEGCVYICVKI